MKTMLDLDIFFNGRDQAFAHELTDEIRANAAETIARTNALLQRSGFGHICTVNSGWRPPLVNASVTNASPTSHHLTGRAVDLPDRDRTLAAWCVAHLEVLAEIGLWLEDPRWTYDSAGDHWVHLQTVPPRSGNRVFMPSDTPAKDPGFPVTWV
ncbi:MAG: D-Ala-D-Ala carboxypeptidase family metallohydrolase [Betaproteobacteria bacterium]